MPALSVIPTQTDPRLLRWKRILQKCQNVAGTFPRNDPKPDDTLRRTQVKIVKSLAGISSGKF